MDPQLTQPTVGAASPAMSQPSNPQPQDPPSGGHDHPTTSVAVSPNNNDQPQPRPQPTAPDATKLMPSDANQSSKRVPESLDLKSSTATSEFKGTRAKAIGALVDFKEYVETAMKALASDPPNISKAKDDLKTIHNTLEEDIATWQKALSETSIPSSIYVRPISEWLVAVHSGKPAARKVTSKVFVRSKEC